MDATTTGPVHFINLEYFFRLLYESRPGGPGIGATLHLPTLGGFTQWLFSAWTTFAGASFLFSLIALGLLAYCSMRIYQIKEGEHHRFGLLEPTEAEKAKDHSRWAHVQDLIESPQERDWREAIMEADIMLDDMLQEHHYKGATTGERLQSVDIAKHPSLDAAWDAHKIRNRIVHEGSQFQLDDKTAYRTIKNYETVFREFNEI